MPVCVQCADFTCSAGVACNKLLAKVASAMNKPNQQTVVPPRHVTPRLNPSVIACAAHLQLVLCV